MAGFRTIVVAILAFVGCSAHDGVRGTGDSASASGLPFLGVTPKAVDFGAVPTGSSAEARVAIANVGVADLALDDVRLVQADSSLTADWTGPMSLAVGEFVEVGLRWTPAGFADVVGGLEIATNDVVRPLATVSIVGTTPDPDIEVTPVEWDFGVVDLGTTTVMGVSIANVGDAPLTVTSLDYVTTDSDLTLDDASLPFVVASGESVELRVTYKPTGSGIDAGTLAVGSDDPDEPLVTAEQGGSAVTVYDAFDDFDYENNGETHVWQYGYAASVGGEFKFDTLAFDYGPTSGWARQADHSPQVARNTTGKDAEYTGGFFPGSDFLTMYPGAEQVERYAVLRFVVPSDGTWHIGAAFKTVHLPEPGAIDAHVVVAGFERFETHVEGAYEGDLTIDDPYEETLALTAGDTIDFVVGPGPNADFYYDITAVRATVTLE